DGANADGAHGQHHLRGAEVDLDPGGDHPRHRQNITDRISTMSALVARRYLGDLWRFGGRRLPFVGAVTLAGAVTDGIGLLMLVPLLELVGAGRASVIRSPARGTFHAAGVPVTLGRGLGVDVCRTV